MPRYVFAGVGLTHVRQHRRYPFAVIVPSTGSLSRSVDMKSMMWIFTIPVASKTGAMPLNRAFVVDFRLAPPEGRRTSHRLWGTQPAAKPGRIDHSNDFGRPLVEYLRRPIGA
jgi:hypothetical protein